MRRRRRAAATRRPPTVAGQRRSAPRSAPRARDVDARDAAPAISAMPTARALAVRARTCRAGTPRAGSRAGTRGPRTRLRQRDAAVGGDGRAAATRRSSPAQPHPRRRGARPATGVERQRAAASPRAASSTPATPCRPSSHEPIHGRGVPSNALEARQPGRPWKRAEESKRAARRRPARRARSPARPRATLTQPSTRPASRAAGGENTRSSPGSPSPRSRTSARDEPAVPRVAAERVVAGRALEDVGQPGACEVAAGQRALGEHRRPQRLGRVHAGDLQLADAAGAVRPRLRACDDAIRTRSAPTPRSPSGSRFQPSCTAIACGPPISTAVTLRARGRRRAVRSTYGTSRGRVEAHRRARGGPASSARSACQWVAGSPSSAANGRCSGNCGKPGENGARTTAIAVVDGDGLRVAAARRTGRAPRRRPTAPRPRPASRPRSGPAATATSTRRRLESVITTSRAGAAAASRATRSAGVGDARRGQRAGAARPASPSARAVDDRLAASARLDPHEPGRRGPVPGAHLRAARRGVAERARRRAAVPRRAPQRASGRPELRRARPAASAAGAAPLRRAVVVGAG